MQFKTKKAGLTCGVSKLWKKFLLHHKSGFISKVSQLPLLILIDTTIALPNLNLVPIGGDTICEVHT